MSNPVTLKLDTYDTEARARVSAAQQLADDRGHGQVEPIHLLYCLFDGSERVRAAARQAQVDPDDVLVEGELCLRRLPSPRSAQSYLSHRLLDLLGRAEGEAARERGARVTVKHLLLATAQSAEGDAQIVLRTCGLSAPALRAALSAAAAERGSPQGILQQFGRDLTMAAQQGQFDPIVGRAAELRRLLQVLARRRMHNPLLLGEPGVGRDSIVRALSVRIAEGDVPSLLSRCRVVELDVPALLGGVRSRVEAESQVRACLMAVADQAGEVIVYLRDVDALLGDRGQPGIVHLLSQALREGSLRLIVATDAATQRRLIADSPLSQQLVVIPVESPSQTEALAILRGVVHRYESAHGLSISDPALVAAVRFAQRYLPFAQLPKSAIDLIDEAAARVRVAMQSVPTELDVLERRFAANTLQLQALADDHDLASTLLRDELKQAQAQLTPKLAEMRARWEEELSLLHRIGELKEELEAARRSLGVQPDEVTSASQAPLPALRSQLDEARATLAESGPFVRDLVSEADVAEVVAERTGIPVTRMLEAEADKLLHMEERVSARVIGQAQAVSAVSRAIRRSRVGLRDARRPIGSFLFLGSSGVGKTELAKAMAEFLFDDEAAMTRLDMSEFMEKHAVARLLGSPPGYVDSQEGGFLTEAVRRRPYSVILLDEVEKAHPDVFNVMLQVLDDGRLSDARGRPAHFGDTVIIMTSNIGSEHLLDSTLTQAQVVERMQESLRSYFRPEFLNRIDEVVRFEVLGVAELGQILDLQLAALRRMLAPHEVELRVQPDAVACLLREAHEPAFGARPLRRVLQRRVQDPLAEALLRRRAGPIIVDVTLQDGEIRVVADEAGADLG